MKIIKEGKHIVNVKQVTCVFCGAVLEVTPEDVTIKPPTDFLDVETYQYRCPCCNGINKEDSFYFPF